MSDFTLWLSDAIWDWSTLLTAVGLTGFRLAAKRKWWAWRINIGCQALWITFALVTEQYGFIVAAVFYAYVFGKNDREWTAQHRAELEKSAIDRWRELPDIDPPTDPEGKFG